MTVVHQFDYYKPTSLNSALKLLNKINNYAILAGGTDLINNIRENIDKPDAVIDIKGIKSLKKISFKNNILFIGSAVTFSDIIESKIILKKFPLLIEAANNVASMGIRNRATMAGNLCSCVPCMDSAPPLVLYEASVLLKSINGERVIPITEFFLGPRKTAIQKGEILIGISISYPEKKHASCFVKLKRYSGEDLAQASVAVMVFEDNTYKIAFGSVAPVPIRARKIEEFLNGKKLNDEIIEKAKEIIPEEIAPITDIRATKEYRMHMCKVMFERALKEALERLNGKKAKLNKSLI